MGSVALFGRQSQRFPENLNQNNHEEYEALQDWFPCSRSGHLCLPLQSAALVHPQSLVNAVHLHKQTQCRNYVNMYFIWAWNNPSQGRAQPKGSSFPLASITSIFFLQSERLQVLLYHVSQNLPSSIWETSGLVVSCLPISTTVVPDSRSRWSLLS